MSRTKEGTNDERKEAYGGWPHTARVKLTTATHRKTNLLDKKCLLEEEDIALFLRRYFKIKGEGKKKKIKARSSFYRKYSYSIISLIRYREGGFHELINGNDF